MAVIAKPVMNGAQLIQALVKSGTGDGKMVLPRMHLAFIKRKENRIASAVEIIDIMEKAGVTEALAAWPRTPELTLQKALALASTGSWEGAVDHVEIPVEELLLAGTELPPEEEKPIEEQMVEQFDPNEGYKMEPALGLTPPKKNKGGRPPKQKPVLSTPTVISTVDA